MPDIGQFHPQLVHFVVALGIVGVAFRLVSLSGRLKWTGPAATALILVAAAASWLAAESGHQAHGLAERIPGAREAVQTHEDLGEDTRNIFLFLAVLELAALALRNRANVQRWVLLGSAVTGVAACYLLYETGEHGGRLVYAFAGGVGTRSGDPEDVHRLLVAGLYHEARVKRQQGDSVEAARLTLELAHQVPNDPTVKLLVVESTLRDRHDPKGALAQLDTLAAAAGNDDRMAMRTGMLRSDALVAAGMKDSARAVLTALAAKYPDRPFLADALKKLQ
ncbi:MAG TPA: DUF2231 domain-containing protein [Gemmatimonadales bacterium]|nr:DUF2231 domain-containing protein [Gemmatimonadales bacterium]